MAKNLLGQTLEPVPDELPPIDPTTIAPLNRRGSPDLYNHMPTRFIQWEEAKKRGWLHFYIGDPCRYGHLAPRNVSNPRACVDCYRINDGKLPIGGKVPGDVKRKLGPLPLKGNPNFRKVADEAAFRRPVEPITSEKRFLAAYAESKNFEEACKASGMDEADVESRISYSKLFRDALEDLETRLGIKRIYEKPPELYEWTDKKRDRLVEVYVDTGDLASARDSIGATPSEYFRELKRNRDFSARILEIEPLAHQALEERAIQLALAGNDKLLTKILSVKKPEYKESVKVDMNLTEKLDDRQLQARLVRLINKFRPQDVIEGRAITVIADSRGDGQAAEPSEDRSVLHLTRD